MANRRTPMPMPAFEAEVSVCGVDAGGGAMAVVFVVLFVVAGDDDGVVVAIAVVLLLLLWLIIASPASVVNVDGEVELGAPAHSESKYCAVCLASAPSLQFSMVHLMTSSSKTGSVQRQVRFMPDEPTWLQGSGIAEVTQSCC